MDFEAGSDRARARSDGAILSSLKNSKQDEIKVTFMDNPNNVNTSSTFGSDAQVCVAQCVMVTWESWVISLSWSGLFRYWNLPKKFFFLIFYFFFTRDWQTFLRRTSTVTMSVCQPTPPPCKKTNNNLPPPPPTKTNKTKTNPKRKRNLWGKCPGTSWVSEGLGSSHVCYCVSQQLLKPTTVSGYSFALAGCSFMLSYTTSTGIEIRKCMW